MNSGCAAALDRLQDFCFMAIKAANREPCTPPRSTLILTPAFVVYTELGIDPFISRRACSSWLYHMTPSYFASTWLGDCMPRHVMIWSLDCRWYTASCFLPSSKLYIRICR